MDKKSINLKANMRGIRKCKFCEHYNGFRAKGCKNKTCISFVNNTASKTLWIDPIELISYNSTRIFSVRVKEREIVLRNFVEVTDTTLSTEDDYTSIVNRNAVCYVDTCKYDVRDLGIICKHVKSATICNKTAKKLDIDRNVIDCLKLTKYSKDTIWNMYIENMNNVPSLQRLNEYTFTVECTKNSLVPAGRLHVIAAPNGYNINKLKKQYLCACEQYKATYSISSTLIPRENICFHILLVLIGIMSSSLLKSEFQNFCTLFQNIWSNQIIHEFRHELFLNEHCSAVTEANNNKEQVTSNNSFNDLLILFQNTNESPSHFLTRKTLMYQDTINKVDQVEYRKEDTEILKILDMKNNENFEFTDSTDITLTDQINFFNNDESGNLRDMESYSYINEDCNKIDSDDLVVQSEMDLPNIYDMNESNNTLDLNEVSEFYITEKLNKIDVEHNNQINNTSFLSFNDWLNFVIEKINQSLFNFNAKNTKIIHQFNIHENFFTLLHNKFSTNDRKLLPNTSINLKKFETNNLIKHSWLFSSKSILKTIFKTETTSIEFENVLKSELENKVSDKFNRVSNNLNGARKYRAITPRTKILYIRLINDSNSDDKSYFIVEWIPNVYPKSKFGVLNLEYDLDIKLN